MAILLDWYVSHCDLVPYIEYSSSSSRTYRVSLSDIVATDEEHEKLPVQVQVGGVWIFLCVCVGESGTSKGELKLQRRRRRGDLSRAGDDGTLALFEIPLRIAKDKEEGEKITGQPTGVPGSCGGNPCPVSRPGLWVLGADFVWEAPAVASPWQGGYSGWELGSSYL